MKNYFPFTDYDFYAYLTSGMIVLFALDYGFNNGAIMLREDWPFVQIVFAVAIAYLVGQMVAGVASILLEHWIARRVLRPPVAIMMCLGAPRSGESFIGRWIVGRYYQPNSDGQRAAVLRKVAKKLGKQPEEIIDPEDIFQVAFPVARQMPGAVERMDDFRKLYGFSRNVALSGLIAAGALAYRAAVAGEIELYWWALLVIVFSIAMFGRFLKFYAAYGAEVLRSYAASNVN